VGEEVGESKAMAVAGQGRGREVGGRCARVSHWGERWPWHEGSGMGGRWVGGSCPSV
jgi:hypothetical protein